MILQAFYGRCRDERSAAAFCRRKKEELGPDLRRLPPLLHPLRRCGEATLIAGTLSRRFPFLLRSIQLSTPDPRGCHHWCTQIGWAYDQARGNTVGSVGRAPSLSKEIFCCLAGSTPLGPL